MSKIVGIEDNVEVRENMAEILMLSDYDVITATIVKKAWKWCCTASGLDCCDIMIPVLDGCGVLQLLSKHEETASIPFVF